ncbi:hypothetical protein [Methylobacter sp.]|uniref:hypothetical protein n=1 Tax=Methylobacter sp. TaxID=2051955 RepID=UPI002FDEBA2D
MKKIESMLQIKNGMAVIAAEDLAVLLGRNHLSVIRAIDAIPTEYLDGDMFFMAAGEVFLTQAGICMVDMSKRHLRMRRRIMMALSIFDADYRESRWVEFHAAMPPRAIIRLLAWLDNVGLKRPALLLFTIMSQLKKYDPSKGLNVPKAVR